VGQSATAPLSFPGAAGSVQVITNSGAWLHSFAVRSVLQFAKDAYLNGRIAETRQLLGEYQALLRAHQRVVAPDEELTDEEFSEKVNLDQLLAEVENLVHRIDSNLDYFGNPAGWVPMLSFEANFLAFQNEVEHSVPILYLAYWLNYAATNLQASLAATDFTPTSGNLRELNVRVSGDLEPVIALSQPDTNSRQDGQGDFSRVFPSFTLVTLQAPSTYGQFVFDRWFVNNQPQTAQVPAVAVFVMGNTQVEARYRLPAPLVLTTIAVPAGQIGFSFPSEPGANYILEQSPRLTNPVWAPVETRIGDGTTLQFTRPIGAAPATFFRLRVEQ
jgi:hypothetical protein